jgi:two-component system, chemotaxis family, protein-glutamate methylesterase/glutaminase
MSEATALSGREIDAVVVGASAGGVEALSTLLSALPAHASFAVLIVQHLPKDRRNLLPEIFGPKCALPVLEALDKQPVEPGTVYVAAPDYHLLVDEGRTLALSIDEPVHFSRPSVDVLFESAAAAYGSRLMGIVLTGANADGAAGLRAVHEAGGITVVQDPGSAQASLMPASALQRVPASQVLPLAGIAALLRTAGARGGPSPGAAHAG